MRLRNHGHGNKKTACHFLAAVKFYTNRCFGELLRTLKQQHPQNIPVKRAASAVAAHLF